VTEKPTDEEIAREFRDTMSQLSRSSLAFMDVSDWDGTLPSSRRLLIRTIADLRERGIIT
jgi:hypothetical protein